MLRCYASKDAAGILQLAGENREHLIREFAKNAGLQSVREANCFVKEKKEQWNAGKAYCYGIWRKHQKKLIGQIQIKNIVWEIPSAEIGYFIDSSCQRQGYASQSIREILRLAFQELEFQRIFVRILPSNRESFYLAKKLGFHKEGLHRKAFRCGLGELHDVQYLSLIREDYLRDGAQ